MRRHLTSRPLLLIDGVVNTPLTISTTVVRIPSTWIPSGASAAFLCCDTLGGGIKLAFGVDPSTTYGIDLGPGHMFEIRDNVALLEQARFVRATSTDGRISFLLFQEP